MSNFLRNPWIKNGFQFSLHYPARAQIIQILGHSENDTLRVLLSDSTNIVLAVLSKESLEKFRETVATPYSEIKGCFITLEDYSYCYDSKMCQPYIFLKEFRYCGSESPIIGEPLDLIYDLNYKLTKEFKIFQPFTISDICIPEEEIKKQINSQNQQYLKEVLSDFYSDCNFLNETENIGCISYDDGIKREENNINNLKESTISILNETKETIISDSVHESFSSSCPTDLILDAMQSDNLSTEKEQANPWILFDQDSYSTENCVKHLNKSKNNIENYKSRYFNRICNTAEIKDVQNISELEEYLIKYDENLFENDIVDRLETNFMDEDDKNSDFLRFEEKNNSKSKNIKDSLITIMSSSNSTNLASSRKSLIKPKTENIFSSSMKGKASLLKIETSTRNSLFKRRWSLKRRNIQIKLKCLHCKNIESKIESDSEKKDENKNIETETEDDILNTNYHNLETNLIEEINVKNINTETEVKEHIYIENQVDLKVSSSKKISEEFNFFTKILKRKKPFEFDPKEDDFIIKRLKIDDISKKNNLDDSIYKVFDKIFTDENKRRSASFSKGCNEIIRCTNQYSEKAIEIFPKLFYCSVEKQKNNDFGFFCMNNYNKRSESMSLQPSESRFHKKDTNINSAIDFYNGKIYKKVRWSDDYEAINCKVYICTTSGKSIILHNPNQKILQRYIEEQNIKYENFKPIYIEFYRATDIKISNSRIFKTFSYPNLNGWAYNFETEVLDFYNFLFQLEFSVKKYFEKIKWIVKGSESVINTNLIITDERKTYLKFINLQNLEEILKKIYFLRGSDYMEYLTEEKDYFIRVIQLFPFELFKANILKLESYKNKTETFVEAKRILCLPYSRNIKVQKQNYFFIRTRSPNQNELKNGHSFLTFQENIPINFTWLCNTNYLYQRIIPFMSTSGFYSIKTQKIPMKIEFSHNSEAEKTFDSKKNLCENNLDLAFEIDKIIPNSNRNKNKIKELNQPIKKTKLVISHNDGYFEHSNDIILSQIELYDEEELFLFDPKL